MKQLEDKIKDRLEGFESRLPDGDLTEFKALLDNPADGKKQKTPLLAWLVPVAIAAGLALLIMFGHNPQPETIIEKGACTTVAENEGDSLPQRKEVSPQAQQQAYAQTSVSQSLQSSLLSRRRSTAIIAEETHVAALSEDTAQSEPIKPEKLPESDSTFTASSEMPATVLAASEVSTASDVSTATVMPTDSATMIASTDSPSGSSASNADSPSSVADDLGQSTKKKFLKWRTYLLSGAGTMALAYAILPDLQADDYDDDINSLNNRFEHMISQGMYYVCEAMPFQKPKLNTKTGDDSHNMPLRVGLSLRLPLSKRWSLTSGADYSLYSSRINYSVSGDRKQNAHYLGIPLRADFTIAHSRWVDVYVGAGASADFCVLANENGYAIEKDGASFSLNGVGGVQLNITKNIGIYLDPTFSWNIPTDNLKLKTYKSEHQFMFSLSSGVRFTLRR